MSHLSAALDATVARIESVRAIARTSTIVEYPTASGWALDADATASMLRRKGVADGLEMTAALKVAEERVAAHNARLAVRPIRRQKVWL